MEIKELKVGDWVKVTSIIDDSYEDMIGEVGQIKSIDEHLEFPCDVDMINYEWTVCEYHPVELTVITDEEVMLFKLSN